jgi:PTH1 family peptidyl-tRNA hydrolase
MTGKKLQLLVGLGNPGRKYSRTRHNVGFMVADRIAENFSINLNSKKFDTEFGKGQINGNNVIIVKPMAYMNRSGPPVLNLAKYYNILIEDLLVIHDDIDLDFERIKIKSKGGHGGHKGIKSLIDAFGSGDFSRIRIGVGRPEVQMDVSDHVLGKFSSGEKKFLDRFIERSDEAAVNVLCEGIIKGMNRFNFINI